MVDRIAHEPVPRRDAYIVAETGVTLGQAWLAGVCMAVAAAHPEAPILQVILVPLGLAVLVAWGAWLLGGSGLGMAALNLPLAILAVDAAVVSLGIVKLDPQSGPLLGNDLRGLLPALLTAAAALGGLAAGFALPGPLRLRKRLGSVRAIHGVEPEISQGQVLERLRAARHVPAAVPQSDGSLPDDDRTAAWDLSPFGYDDEDDFDQVDEVRR